MSRVKNNPNIKLYYTDTDSAYVSGPLPSDLVSETELGKFKLEYIAKRAVFLGPKFYILELEDGGLVVKVKGLNSAIRSTLSFDDFTSLLHRDSRLEVSQEKWFRSMEEGSITIKEQLYSLMVTASKRKLEYSDDGYLIKTTPYTLQAKTELGGVLS